MLVNPGSICQLSVGSTHHSLRVFLKIEDGLEEAVAEREFTEWMLGRERQDVYDDLKVKIASGSLETHEGEIPYNWYRCALFVGWLLGTGKGVSAMTEAKNTETILVAAYNEDDDGDWVGQVRPFARHGDIRSVVDADPSSPELARWREIQAKHQAKSGPTP